MCQDMDMIMSSARAADQLLDQLEQQLGIGERAQAAIRAHMVRDARAVAPALWLAVFYLWKKMLKGTVDEITSHRSALRAWRLVTRVADL